MLATLTLPGTFFFYSAVSLVGSIVLYFILPETEGRSLIEIEKHFSGGPNLKEKSRQTDDEEKRRDATVVTAQTRPKADFVLGIPITEKIQSTTKDRNQKVCVDLKNWDSDRIFQQHLGDKKEKLHNQHQYRPLYVQNPRAYMRHNSRTKVGEDNNVAVFSTHL